VNQEFFKKVEGLENGIEIITGKNQEDEEDGVEEMEEEGKGNQEEGAVYAGTNQMSIVREETLGVYDQTY